MTLHVRYAIVILAIAATSSWIGYHAGDDAASRRFDAIQDGPGYIAYLQSLGDGITVDHQAFSAQLDAELHYGAAVNDAIADALERKDHQAALDTLDYITAHRDLMSSIIMIARASPARYHDALNDAMANAIAIQQIQLEGALGLAASGAADGMLPGLERTLRDRAEQLPPHAYAYAQSWVLHRQGRVDEAEALFADVDLDLITGRFHPLQER